MATKMAFKNVSLPHWDLQLQLAALGWPATTWSIKAICYLKNSDNDNDNDNDNEINFIAK